MELLYRAAFNERLWLELPCLWDYPPTTEWLEIDALFEAPALWGEEIILEELGLDKSLIKKRIKICSMLEREINLIIHGGEYREQIECEVRRHVELVERHWNNIHGKDYERIYDYVANELMRLLDRDFIEEYLNSVKGKRAIGCKIVYNPHKTFKAHIIPRIDLYTWITLLNRCKKKSITIDQV